MLMKPDARYPATSATDSCVIRISFAMRMPIAASSAAATSGAKTRSGYVVSPRTWIAVAYTRSAIRAASSSRSRSRAASIARAALSACPTSPPLGLRLGPFPRALIAGPSPAAEP